MSDWETYRNAVNAAPNKVQEILRSDELALLIDSIEKDSDVKVNRQELLILFSDFLVNLTDTTNLQRLVGKYLDSPKIEDVALQLNRFKSLEISTEKVAAVNPVRTMAEDMQSAQEGTTYSSNQDAILQPNQPPQT